MFKYNNTHIFTGYLKQLLSSFNLPACKVYTHEFAKYLEQTGKEDPRVLESFDNIKSIDNVSIDRIAIRINYLKNNEIYNYFWKQTDIGSDKANWQRSTSQAYSSDKSVPGLTRNLDSPGISYDTKTHEYLGDYLRFLRDYYNINLMSLYNCFNDKICNNIYYRHTIKIRNSNEYIDSYSIFDSQDSNYRIYAVPVRLFAEYTVAIDCNQGIELFCGFYNTNLDMSDKAMDLAKRTYQKVNKTLFSQPFLYDKLTVKGWSDETDFTYDNKGTKILRTNTCTRWDITNREKDLKLFIKVPVSCRSTITILEGNYLTFNDVNYTSISRLDAQGKETKMLTYQSNHSVLNFNTTKDKVNLNNYDFKPISKLQLLAFNTGESYPFADRLIEYLSGSAITPIDEIPDNIKRVQRVMKQNGNYFKIEGLWENKMQNILYDYMINSGPIEIVTIGDDRENDPDNYSKKIYNLTDYKFKTKQVLRDRHSGASPIGYGYHPRLGHAMKSTQYDVLGYVDKDTEKLYASWKKVDDKAKVSSSLQTVDIYDKLYDI